VGGAALVAVVLVVVLVWPVGVLTGGDENGKATARGRGQARIVGQLVLRPVAGAQGAGVAVIAQQGNQRQLIVQARLQPNKNREAYEVWLFNSKGDARSLGAQVTDQQGTYQGAGPLPNDFRRYRYIDISREQVDQNTGHSGSSVLRGEISKIQRPAPGAQSGGQGALPGQTAPQTTP
jgi:hypothetical protein